jgi:hypothetical protein
MWWKLAQREGTMLCRFSGVFWNNSQCVLQVTWCRECWRCWLYLKSGRKSEWRYRWEEGIHTLEILWFDSYAVLCWLMNPQWPINHLVDPPGISWMRSLETRYGTHGEDSLWCWALNTHRIPHWPLRYCASQSKLSYSEVISSVQPSNTAMNA